jgi:Escherichia/Staphylococcus phage prohead protease
VAPKVLNRTTPTPVRFSLCSKCTDPPRKGEGNRAAPSARSTQDRPMLTHQQLAPQPGARTIDADGTVEGYASLFGVVDSTRDMMLPGAFARTLRSARRVPMLFQHDPAAPIGLWLVLEEDARGLRACGRLIPGVQRSREVLALIRAGALDGLSIGFRTVRARVDPVTRVRRIHEVDLWEVSIVTFPLLAGARVSAAKDDFLARIFPARRIAKYSPDQPRVPAGNPDGGQWIGIGGQGAARVRLAQSATGRYSVNLDEEEAPRGIGHTIREHVGKSDVELMAIARADWSRRTIGRFEITDFRLAHGSFASREAATDFVNRTLENDKTAVDRVANGLDKHGTLDRRFGFPTGREVFRPTGDAEPYVRDTHGVRVVIRHEPRSERGYGVLTAFPINEDSRR